MPSYFGRVRRVGLIVAGVGSGFLGLIVAWTLVQPGIIGGVGTGALLAIFGLLALPAIVYWSWCADTRAAARQAARARTLAESASPSVLTFTVQPLRLPATDRAVAPSIAATRDPSREIGRDAGVHTHVAAARVESQRQDQRRRVGPAVAARRAPTP